MSFTHRSIATVTFPYFPLNPPTPKTPNFTPLRSFNNNNNKTLISVNPKSSFRIRASAASDNSQPPWWANLLPAQALGSDKVLRLISGATASPIGQYVSEPVTFLHSLDPRVKLVWLLALVVLPARSHIILRFGLVVYLAILSIWVLPRHAWMDQLGRVSLISGLLFIMLGLGADGAPALVQLRTPPPAITGLSNLPASLAGYSYLIFKLGPIQFTRKGLSVASTAACLTFTVFQSASLCLTTTTPEELAFALRWFMLPLTNLGVPVAEVILTLMLSLRFISLVFDEVRNVALGIVSRRIDWQQLTMVETIDVFFAYFRRIFKNIFSHAEQISQAMIARGFRGDCNTHKMYLLSDPSIGIADVVSLLCLAGIIGAAVWSDFLI
ncbi:putative ABC/ECF transporter, transmembrane component [Rosa chinensis]|uniref:Putative ABC/ECF transporter, transmembrane component n=1 Tax=Rosa chinensis TaxID=74649 RepID=A0A2P6QXR5_ROSCH|nr:protein ABCI12, chloroplastic isoform X1 [Rosa chinensis]XP_024197388.1 protein ABCI12, chloroplastic isoform X1 [Rosa chinensis]XP_024197389.1 protein ABCI12, chloroplastic isoform X1 [Rosa chinensis]PRQ38899.1 putative ABC/ECF transporter, transmembrane component [Rosa chinensis]